MSDVLNVSFDQLSVVLLDCERRVSGADYTTELMEVRQDFSGNEAAIFTGTYDLKVTSSSDPKRSTKGHDRIPVKTDTLHESLVYAGGAGIIHDLTPRGLLFGTDSDNPVLQQVGTARLPALPPVGMTEKTLDKLTSKVADATVQKMKFTTNS